MAVQKIHSVIFFKRLQHHYYSTNKTRQKRTADKDDEIGGKKGQDKWKRIIYLVGGDQQMHPEIQVKATDTY